MVSVIIPFHNRSELMPRLFASLNEVVELGAEIIFVDNNSDTEARDMVEQFVAQFNESQTLIQARIITELTPGSTAARNAGLDAAKGDYVYFFDSDDEFSPTMLIEAYKLATNTGAQVIGLRTAMVMPNGTIRQRNLVRSKSAVFQIVANNFATQSLFLRRDFALRHARWDETLFYWNDLEWGLRVLMASPSIAWLSGVYHKVYKHADSITGESFAASTDKILQVHSVMQSDIRQADISSSTQLKLLRALNCRIALYAGHVYHEGAHADAARIYATIEATRFSAFHRLKLTILYALSRRGVPGIWRLALL